jgi:uncharacterized membrane protein YtjA (UPF0391 family)
LTRFFFTLAWRVLWVNGGPPTGQPTSWRAAGHFLASIQEDNAMLHYALVFLVIAIIAAVLGFGGIAGAAAGIAKILFVIFLIFAILAFFRRAR